MRNLLAVTAMTAFSVAALTSPIWAERAGDLEITKAMLRATPPAAPVAGGYVVIENSGNADDRLIAATVGGDVVGRTELHQMTMSDGVMSMSEVEGGISIPAGETVVMQPGGLHLMMMGLTGPLQAGDLYEVTLTFEEAGDVAVDFSVFTLGEIRATFEEAGAMGHGAHSGHGN